jgi:SAM-dependent methyltransferase
MQPHTPALCPACGARQQAWAAKNHHLLSLCVACGTVVARGQDPAARTPAQHATYHEGASFELPDVAAASLDEVVRSANGYRQSGRWLVGFGEGALLRVAERRGWQCYGVEVSPHALDFGRARGWTVAEPLVADRTFADGAFDVLSMIEVIEHLEAPAQALRRAIAWLRPGGLLFLTTPNARSLNRLLLGSDWSILRPPEHLTIWSPRGPRTLLLRLGLTRIRLRTHGLNPAQVLAARTSLGEAVHRQHAAENLNHALSQTPVRRAAKRIANRLLSLAGVGDSLKVWCEKPT